MRAIVQTKYGAPEVLNVADVASPRPEPSEVRVRIRAAAVNATDPVFRKGRPLIARFASGLSRPKFTIPGDVFAGEIDSVGSAVKRFKPGDAVFGTDTERLGAHAEFKCLAASGALALKPENMSFGEAAAICDGALTALPFLRDHAKVSSGMRVLIYGASGSIGTFAVQLAKYYGAEVTGVCSGANIKLVQSLGADWVIDYTRQDFTRMGRPFDVVFDTVGKLSFRRSKRALKPGGIYLRTVPTLALMLQMAWTTKFGNRRAKIVFTGLRSASDKSDDLGLLKDLVEAEAVRTVIDREYRLDEIAEAHRYVEGGHKKGNVVLTI